MAVLPEYWIDRIIAEELVMDKSTEQYYEGMRKAFVQAEQRILQQVETFYARYAKEHGMSADKAVKQLTNKERKNFLELQQDYLDTLEKLGMRPSKLKERQNGLDKMSGMAYIQRQQEVLMNISAELDKLYTRADNDGVKLLERQYTTKRALNDFYKEKDGLGVSFSEITDKQAKAAVNAKWREENFSSRIWEHKDKLIRNLNDLLPTHFVRSSGTNEIAEELANRMNVSVGQASRLIHTEMHQINARATFDDYKKNGITRYRFISTLDNRTSDLCRTMDGKTFNVDTAQQGVNIPPLHPWCRSTTIAEFDDLDFEADVFIGRAARDESGKTYHEAKYMNFHEWADTKLGAYAKGVVMETPEYIRVLENIPPAGAVAAILDATNTPIAEPTVYNGLTETQLNNELSMYFDQKLVNDYAGIEEVLEQADLDHKILLHHFKRKFKFQWNNPREGSYLSPAKEVKNSFVHMKVENEKKDGSRNPQSASVLWHELGHYIDYLYSQKKFNTNTLYTALEGKSGLWESIKSDYTKLIESKMREVYEERPHITELPKASQKALVDRAIDGELYFYTKGTDEEVLSDIIGGLSDNKYRGMWGHPNSYWAGKKKVGAVPMEFFAHMFSYNMRKGTGDSDLKVGLNHVKELLPEAVKTYNKIIKEMVDSIREEQ